MIANELKRKGSVRNFHNVFEKVYESVLDHIQSHLRLHGAHGPQDGQACSVSSYAILTQPPDILIAPNMIFIFTDGRLKLRKIMKFVPGHTASSGRFEFKPRFV